MAQIYGLPGEEPGDQLVYEALDSLPDDFLVYAQKKLVHDRDERNPDYVIVHRDLGVIVLEVKDWIQIEKRDEKEALVYRYKQGKAEWDTSPVEQARQAAILLKNKLVRHPDLGNYSGKLDFPYRFAGVLPHIPAARITWLEQAWGQGKVLGREDLNAWRITEKIRTIPAPFYAPMSQRQFDAVRGILDPLNIAKDHQTGRFKGIYDPQQEAIAKEPLKRSGQAEADNQPTGERQPEQKGFLTEIQPELSERLSHLQETTPPEVSQLKELTNIRLVRGYAGTGKTDVLVLRAHFIHQNYPEKAILTTTFNRPLLEERLIPELKGIADVFTFDELCRQIFENKTGSWVFPQSTEGIIAHLAERQPLINEVGQHFLAEEIIWMKENRLTDRQAYLDFQRAGRAGLSQPLNRKKKSLIFDLFEQYQADLREVSPHDWPDFHEKVLKYLCDGIRPAKRYDVILVDEAQHFAPTWMHILSYFLNPGGMLFLCDDPSQSVYRQFSWRQRGIEVVGRTRWLRIPYRNTRQIFEAAYTLIAANLLARKMLEESEEVTLPDLKDAHMREGERPHVYCFHNVVSERNFVQRKVQELVHEGLLPGEICLLHTRKHVINAYRGLLPAGVQVDDLRRRTGLEYPAVIIPQIQELFDRDSQYNWEEDQARQQIQFYMAMTRARDHLYMLYEQKWPKAFEPVRSQAVWHLH